MRSLSRSFPAAILLAAVAVAPAAHAQNSIRIDAATAGSVGSLVITQDSANPSNSVSGAGGGTTDFAVTGAWSAVAISQTGANNTLGGAITNQVSGTGSNSFTATFTGGGNNVNTLVHVETGATGNSFTLNAAGSTNLQYGVYSTAAGSSVATTLSNIAAGGGGVYVEQAGTGANATVSLTVNGGGFKLGSLTSPSIAAPLQTFFSGTAPGVALYQTGSSAITATVTPTANGYTASITSSVTLP